MNQPFDIQSDLIDRLQEILEPGTDERTLFDIACKARGQPHGPALHFLVEAMLRGPEVTARLCIAMNNFLKQYRNIEGN